MPTEMVEIRGNTYPYREQLKALGGEWNKAKKCWMVPADKAEIARTLVSQRACGTKPRSHSYPSPRACKTCGIRINYGVYCGKCEYA